MLFYFFFSSSSVLTIGNGIASTASKNVSGFYRASAASLPFLRFSSNSLSSYSRRAWSPFSDSSFSNSLTLLGKCMVRPVSLTYLVAKNFISVSYSFTFYSSFCILVNLNLNIYRLILMNVIIIFKFKFKHLIKYIWRLYMNCIWI